MEALRSLDFLYPSLSVVGGATSLYFLYKTLDAAYFYLRPSSLSRYLHSPSGGRPWALITGASDGIGKGFAEELSSQGFNIILHGRNQTKLEGVRKDLKSRFPDADYRIVILDAVNFDHDGIARIANEVADLHITVLINNVGGSGPVSPVWGAVTQRKPSELDCFIDVNARFPTHITRALLPKLIATTPSLIINVGSLAGSTPSAYLTAYSASKAYNLAWSRSLTAEMHGEGKDVEVLGLLVGGVKAGHDTWDKTTFFVPGSRDFARASLARVGCGKAVVVPYVGHALQLLPLSFLPDGLVEKGLLANGRGMMKAEADRLRKAS